MKKNCISCGIKTSHLDIPLELAGDHVLCRDCAGSISYDINRIYKNMPKDQFEQIKENIIDSCQNRFTQNITDIVIDTINARYGIDDVEENKRRKEEQTRLYREHMQLKIDNLNKMGLDGYYEYKVVSLQDESGFFKKNSGKVDVVTMTEKLNELGLEGWHLITAYSNELGKNALSGGAGGTLFGVNSTVDENILIFERFVKITKE